MKKTKRKTLAKIIMVFHLLRWWHQCFELREINQKKIVSCNQKKKSQNNNNNKKPTTIKTTIGSVLEPLFSTPGSHIDFSKCGLFFSSVCSLFSGSVFSEKIFNLKSRVRGPGYISYAPCWMWEEERGWMWY